MRAVLSIIAALPLLSASAFGWGCEGHEMIALIARAHLTPQASAEVDRLLRENPVDPALNRFCKDRPNDLMADSATWADDVKNIEMNGEWHYIDIPRAVTDGNEKKWCEPWSVSKPRCIETAIDYEWAILRDKAQPDPARAKALRYLIHLIGDLTQPLHAVDNHDQGGNCTEMSFFSDANPARLHAIWDYRILQRDLEARKESKAEYAHSVDAEFRGANAGFNFLALVWESHRLALDIAYGSLHPPIPVASPAAGTADSNTCATERAEVAALHISIGDDYVNRAVPVIRQQLAKAGYGIASLLNGTLH